MNEQSPTNDPKRQPRMRVVAKDGSELSPAAPRSIRKMVSTGVAVIKKGAAGSRFVQLNREVGGAIPHD